MQSQVAKSCHHFQSSELAWYFHKIQKLNIEVPLYNSDVLKEERIIYNTNGIIYECNPIVTPSYSRIEMELG